MGRLRLLLSIRGCDYACVRFTCVLLLTAVAFMDRHTIFWSYDLTYYGVYGFFFVFLNPTISMIRVAFAIISAPRIGHTNPLPPIRASAPALRNPKYYWLYCLRSAFLDGDYYSAT